MGLLLLDKTADYSASPIAHAGLYTSITNGLQALYETRRNGSKATNNSVPGLASGNLIGAPTFGATSMSVAPTAYEIFNSQPLSGGLTVAAIIQVKNGGTASDAAISSFVGGGVATQGYFQMEMFNRRMQMEWMDYPYPATPPLPGASEQQANVFIDMDAGGADDGNYEMFIGILEPNVSARLYRPKKAILATTARVGRDMAYDNSPNFRTSIPTAVNAQSMSLFAHWNRVLSPTEYGTFYTEIQRQYSLLGLAI